MEKWFCSDWLIVPTEFGEKMKREYYWLKTRGEIEKISEPAFYFLLDRKKHTLIQVAGARIVLNQGTNSILIKKKQLEQILVEAAKD